MANDDRVDRVLTVGPSHDGYCLQCGKPKKVAPLTVRGFPNQVDVCAACLTFISNKIEPASAMEYQG